MSPAWIPGSRPPTPAKIPQRTSADLTLSMAATWVRPPWVSDRAPPSVGNLRTDITELSLGCSSPAGPPHHLEQTKRTPAPLQQALCHAYAPCSKDHDLQFSAKYMSNQITE